MAPSCCTTTRFERSHGIFVLIGRSFFMCQCFYHSVSLVQSNSYSSPYFLLFELRWAVFMTQLRQMPILPSALWVGSGRAFATIIMIFGT